MIAGRLARWQRVLVFTQPWRTRSSSTGRGSCRRPASHASSAAAGRGTGGGGAGTTARARGRGLGLCQGARAVSGPQRLLQLVQHLGRRELPPPPLTRLRQPSARRRPTLSSCTSSPSFFRLFSFRALQPPACSCRRRPALLVLLSTAGASVLRQPPEMPMESFTRPETFSFPVQ